MGLDTQFGTLNQPAPEESAKSQPVTDLVIADLQARRESGIKKYGKELSTYNGRDALLDLYQELLDAVVYCRQHLQESAGDGGPSLTAEEWKALEEGLRMLPESPFTKAVKKLRAGRRKPDDAQALKTEKKEASYS